MPNTITLRPSAPGQQPDERNRLLKALSPEVYARLVDEAESLELGAKQVLWPAGVPIRSVYFPRTCVVSLIVPLHEDRPIEAATVGNEGFVGAPVALGVQTTTITAIAQVAGTGLRLPAATFAALNSEHAELRLLVLAHAHTLMEQAAQTVACNRRHELSERCARWLLMTHDRVGASSFGLTQDFLAIMLGVRRAGVTVAAGTLQRAGLLKYSRGRVEVLDRDGLEAASCECYRVLADSYERAVRLPPS
ncbi:MAG TPA: Crp/Fnr family transcriptional regulator [Gemmatimonadaceae bacterium]|nr:Crp/Fnr family transcriptional regulator [Gemmatimonadaceae bacterium]